MFGNVDESYLLSSKGKLLGIGAAPRSASPGALKLGMKIAFAESCTTLASALLCHTGHRGPEAAFNWPPARRHLRGINYPH